MPIPVAHARRFAYHFSHIDNLPGLLRRGFLANNDPMFPERHRSVAAASIQRRRAQMVVPCGPGGCVHDYVPLYFGSTSPMLLSVVNTKNVDQYDMLYFEFPISLVNRPDTVFTDASANTEVPPSFYDDAEDLAQLDWSAIDSSKWGNVDDAFRHRRMAELLIRGPLPVTAAARCVVWNESVANRVWGIVGDAPFPSIEFESRDRRHWFKDFLNRSQGSIVKGPGEVAGIFARACGHFDRHAGGNAQAAVFRDLRQLRDRLRIDFGCLPHTAELVGLRSENGLHRHTVDVHTKEVVAVLSSLPEFQGLDEETRLLVEVAAYLHDIGKGPRSRWDKNDGLQKADPNHPVNAMPMMVDILTYHVAAVAGAQGRTLMKLVCYHDLVGDVFGNDRDESQIVDVADTKGELDMLFALGRADATALVEQWGGKWVDTSLYDRCLEAIKGEPEV